VKGAAKGGKGLDAVWLGREFLRNADFVLKAAEDLDVVVRSVVQYERPWTKQLK
jgi:2,4-dienoyl-CoA reductase-like NADH-dependent reductase (Old Yellow Enzyme family)